MISSQKAARLKITAAGASYKVAAPEGDYGDYSWFMLVYDVYNIL